VVVPKQGKSQGNMQAVAMMPGSLAELDINQWDRTDARNQV
jgi:hypothetical protein